MSSQLQKPNIDQLLASTNLNNSIIELYNYISAFGGDDMTALSYPQLVFYYNQELESEVNNGGFDQYFNNSSGEYAHETVQSLRLIGANKTAGILESAIAMFPDNIVPVDRDLRDEVLENIRDEATATWEELDNKFFKYEDDLNALNMEFVRKNKEYF